MSETAAKWKLLETIGLGSSPPTLLYFADPMCSWCWGFAPVITAIAGRYHHALPVHCVVGGLRAGNTVPTDPAFREEILHHWRTVRAQTGQSFSFEGALPDGFIYDTEPACRAVVTMMALNESGTLNYLHDLQRAFYVEQRDVTRADVLVTIAESGHVAVGAFRAAFDSDAVRERTEAHFRLTRQFGVRGFPTIIVLNTSGAELLTSGYAPLEVLARRLERLLAAAR